MPDQNCNVSEIFTRLKSALQLATDADLAEKFGVTLRRLQTWKTRNTIPTCHIITLSKESGLDLNYVWADSSCPNIVQISSTHTTPHASEIMTTGVKSEQIVDTIQMDNQWLRHSLNVAPENIAVIQVKGNNMSPWVVDGDLVIIDFSETNIINDAPYVIKNNGILLVKRLLDKHDGTITAKSDSPYCEDEIFLQDNLPKIIGRIIRRITR